MQTNPFTCSVERVQASLADPNVARIFELGQDDFLEGVEIMLAEEYGQSAVLREPWSVAREQLNSNLVTATLAAGRLIYQQPAVRPAA